MALASWGSDNGSQEISSGWTVRVDRVRSWILAFRRRGGSVQYSRVLPDALTLLALPVHVQDVANDGARDYTSNDVAQNYLGAPVPACRHPGVYVLEQSTGPGIH